MSYSRCRQRKSWSRVSDNQKREYSLKGFLSRLMFEFRSGTHGLNEGLGRHRGREGRKECLLCDDECESVSHVLWDRPVYNTLRNNYLCKLQELLGDGFEHFESLDSFEKASFVLGSELWEDDFSSILDILLRITSLMFGSYERLSYIMMKISAFHSPSVRMHLGNWGMLGAVVGVCMVR